MPWLASATAGVATLASRGARAFDVCGRTRVKPWHEGFHSLSRWSVWAPQTRDSIPGYLVVDVWRPLGAPTDYCLIHFVPNGPHSLGGL